MKRKGFTLIELLAVIVILAIIALIAVPVILNIIESAKKSSAIDSAYGYVKGVENYLLQKELRNEEKELIIGENNIEEVTKLISVKGNKPVSGIIEINNRNVVTKGVNLCISGYSVQYEIGKEAYISGKCNEEEKEIVIEDKKTCELETEIIDGTEYYYIDSESDLYELSKEVNNGNNFEGKIIKLRNNLDMSNVKNKCGESDFEPIGTSSTPFSGTFEGGAKIISNLVINKPEQDNIGLFGYISESSVYGINISNIKITGRNYIGGLVGYSNKSTIKEVKALNMEIKGTNSIGGILGYQFFGTLTNIIIEGGNIEATNGVVGSITGDDDAPTSVIADNLTIKGNSIRELNDKNSAYYTNTVVVNGVGKTDNVISDYDINFCQSIGIETIVNGDVNGTGYFFDYGSDGKIKVVKAYSYNKGNASVDENYTMTKIVGTTDTTAPTCNLDYVTAVSNGIRASFSCTDESGTPEISSLFDSTTSKSAKTFENIGTIKNGIVNGNTRSVVSTWTTNNSVSIPTRGTCYYFRYGARDSSGNYTTYVTDKCYTGFN